MSKYSTETADTLLARRNELLARQGREEMRQSILASLLLRHKDGQSWELDIRHRLHDSRQQDQWMRQELYSIEAELRARQGERLALPLHLAEASDSAAA